MKLNAVDGLIGADVDILTVATQLPARRIWQAGVSISLAAGGQPGGAEPAGFLERLLAPASGHHKIHRPALREVQGNDGVLGQSATLHEQDFEVVRHRQKFTQISLGMLVNGDELLAPVAHFHHAHAAAVPVQHFGSRFHQNLLRHGSRSGGEIKGSNHHFFNKDGCSRRSNCFLV